MFVEIPSVIAGMVVEQQQQAGQRQQEQFVVCVVRVFPDCQDVAFRDAGVARGVRDSVPVAAQRVETDRQYRASNRPDFRPGTGPERLLRM